MKIYDMAKIRNITLVGAPGSGKTTLAEIMLYDTKAITRIGKVDDGNTVMDFDAEEISRKMSISMGLGYAEFGDHHINIIDTPGYADFVADQIMAMTASETVCLVANAAAGYEVGLELAVENLLRFNGKSKALIVNRMDSENANFFKVIDDLRDNGEINALPILLPIGKEGNFSGVVDVVAKKAYINDKPADLPTDMADIIEETRSKLMEAVAETSEELMEKFFEAGELTDEELKIGLKKGIATGDIVPAFACSATTNKAVNSLIWAICEYLPSPACKNNINVEENKTAKTIKVGADGNLVAYVFKAFSDPSFGDVAYVRVYSGSLKPGMDIYVPEKDAKDRIGNMFHIMGKNRADAGELRAGEIGGLVKLKAAKGLCTMVDGNNKFQFPAVVLPTPVYWKTIKAASQADEDKISSALTKLLDEDPTVKFEINQETHESVLSGIGEQQLLLIQKRLKTRYKVEAELFEPRIPYKETVVSKSDVQYKHKKQTGGRGQYGHVHFRVGPKPRGEGYEFINSIVGGVIPSKFIPAIEKGIQETLEKGIVAGYQVVDIYVDCYFGSYHDVDSSEMAFKIAASQALKQGFKDAKPILLEPIHNVQIIIPNEYMGDVMGDVSTRRGKIVGMEQIGKKQILNAHIPLSELFEYFPTLKSLSQGRGRFTQSFSHYEKLPEELAQKVIASYQEQE